MNIKTESIVSGKILWLEVRGKGGELKHRVENVPNLLCNGAIGTQAILNSNASQLAHTFSTAFTLYEDLPGTWNQTGNTVTRATGAGTFPSAPSQIGNELYWFSAGAETGHRCHVTARASDTSITVSGVTKTITGGSIRRFIVGNSVSSTGSVQTSSASISVGDVLDYTAGTRAMTARFNFSSATSAYTLHAIQIGSAYSRINLPAPISIEVDDQIQFVYTVTETNSGRSQTYELGAESTGIPQKHSMTSIVGSGTAVDVTFSAATHFLAGDKLDLRNIAPKKHSISSASSTSTTFTINTATAHGLSVSDSVTIENASLAGYNGVHTVSAVVDSDTFEITNAANPGAMGASGTARLTTPATYFDDLGLATIASMVSSSVARITSTITGPTVEPGLIGGDPGVSFRMKPGGVSAAFNTLLNASTCFYFTEANAKAIADPTTSGTLPSSGNSFSATSSINQVSSTYSNDFTEFATLNKDAGAGTNITRLKQISFATSQSGYHQGQITFNTPFDKTTAQRLRFTYSKQLKRTLDLTGL